MPALGAAGQEVEEVPHAAVGVAGAEVVAAGALDAAVGLAVEGGDAGQIAVGGVVVAHVGGEGGALGADDGEGPGAGRGEGALVFGAVGGAEDEGGALLDVGQEADEAVGPQGTIGAAAAHVVDDEEVVVWAEQLGQAHGGAVGAGEGVVLDVFGGLLGAELAQALLGGEDGLVDGGQVGDGGEVGDGGGWGGWGGGGHGWEWLLGGVGRTWPAPGVRCVVAVEARRSGRERMFGIVGEVGRQVKGSANNKSTILMRTKQNWRS